MARTTPCSEGVMAVERVGGGGASMVMDPRKEDSHWSAVERRGLSQGWLEGSVSLVDVVDPACLEDAGPELSEAGSSTETPGAWVDEELREVLPLTLTRPTDVEGLPPSCRLEATREVAARLGDGALPDFEPLAPLSLPVGSLLTLEAQAGGPCREVCRLDATTVRVTAMPSRGVVEEPFAGLLGDAVLPEGGGTHTLERALGWTADLDLRQAGVLGHYREFLTSGEVPVTHRTGGVLRSGRVALFTDSCGPAVELRFLRDFAWLDAERVESRQRVVEYDDGGVEVRSHTRFSRGRQLFSTIVVDTDGEQVRGDHSLVLSHLPADAGAALAALFGARREVHGPCHARLRLTDDEALRWRDLARSQVCQRTGMSVGHFDTESRTPDMARWKGSPQLISLALARTPSEVADALLRFHPGAEGLVECLVRLGTVVGSRLPGALALLPASGR